MKKILIILSIAIVLIIAAICIVSTKHKSPEPVQPVQTEQISQPVQPQIIQPKAEPEEEPHKLLDENDMPKSDVNVPEIG